MSLLEKLRQGGRVVSLGEFTLDRERARSKMARFALADKQQFLLEWIQASVALGASSVTLGWEEELELLFPGVELTQEELEGLEDSLLSSPTDSRTRGLKHLAMGLNALQSVQRVVIETAAGSRLVKEPGTVQFLRDGRWNYRCSSRSLLVT